MPGEWQEVRSFWVPGEPVPQPRHKFRLLLSRAFVNGLMASCAKGYGAVWDHLKHATCKPFLPKGHPIYAWKKQIATVATLHRPAEPIHGPIAMDLTFYCSRPQRLFRKKDPDGPVYADSLAVGDIDNLSKAVADAMNDTALWWKDDSQIVGGTPWKMYCAKDNPRCGVAVVVHRLVDNSQTALFAE